MFSYSFLAMASYTVIKPATRSKFIDALGSVNLPFAQLIAGALIGLVMVGYSWMVNRLPRRWCLPITQGGLAAMLLAFWYLFRTDATWVSVAFYLAGLVLGILLISQFWTLANVVYDPRQAKRLFGLIGGGASLGGILGSFLAATYSEKIGTANLLLFSVAFMLLCAIVVTVVVRRERLAGESQLAVIGNGSGLGSREGITLLRKSKLLRLIALVISFAAIGAAIIEQQLNMFADVKIGREATDAITTFLAQVQLWTSLIGFLIQVTLTSRIHRYLGIGFALLLLPIGLGTTAVVILLNAALWAPALARIFDQSLRYTVDKTTREILYMPLPSNIKYSAKPFVDVTVDRFAKGAAAVLLLILVQPWGFGLSWQELSYASIAITGIWILMALKARHGYQAALRQSIATGEIRPAEVSLGVADLSTIETLIQELASPDERRALYAIDLLESLDKRNLITPLLLYHESAAVRTRALSAVGALQPEIAVRWLPAIENMMRSEDAEVRSAAVGALANMRQQHVTDLVRPLLRDKDPRIAMTAAMVLAGSDREGDTAAAETVLTGLVSDTRESAAAVRKDFAVAIRHVPVPRFRRLLIPLLNDVDPDVADEAMRSARKLGIADFIFVPTLISLLRHRRQKSSARELLVGYGESVLSILRHFLRDPEEDIWIRRHIPAVIARIPVQRAMDVLIEALEEGDGFLRFHVIAGVERLHRVEPKLTFKQEPIEALVLKESVRYSEYRSLHRRLCGARNLPKDCLLARVVAEKMKRAVDRMYRLLGMLYPWEDISAARRAIEHADARSRAGALEYLDNLLTGPLRKRLLPLLEETTQEAAIPEGHAFDRQDPAEEAVRRLIHDGDPVLAAAAIHFVWQQGISSLVHELERLFATGDGRDLYVLEAVSWVLAAFRAPETKRRPPWLQPLPAVELAERLRSLPLFGSVTIDELFRISDAGRQVRYEPGRLLYQEALIPQDVLFLLDGRVSLRMPSGETQEITAPAALGFQELLECKPLTGTARTTETTVCLTLTGERMDSLLADNTGLVPGLFRMICRESGRSERVVVKGNQPERPVPAGNIDLNPVNKGLILKTIPLFSSASAEETIALASIATEVQLAADSELFRTADPSALYTLVSGELVIEPPDQGPALHAGPSDIIGIYETLAGIAFAHHARVTRPGVALRIDRDDLFDLLGQQPGLLRQIFSALFRNRIDAGAAGDTRLQAEASAGPARERE